MTRVLKHTMIRKVYWKERRGPGSPLRLQLEDLDMKWPREWHHRVGRQQKHELEGDVCW